MKRKGNIEFFRFMFSLAVVLLHSNYILLPMRGGFLGVEFFALLSGFFLAKESDNNNIKTFENSIKESLKVIIKQYKKIFPILLLSSLVGLIIIAKINCFSRREIVDYLLMLPNDLLLAQCFGVPLLSITGVIWYLSSYFATLFIIGPFIKYKYDIFTKLIAPLIVLGGYGLLLRNYGTICVAGEYYNNLISCGLIRILADVSLGILVYEYFYKKICNHCFSNIQIIILSLIEIILYVLLFLYMTKWVEGELHHDERFLFLLALALCLTLSQQTILANVLDNKLSICLGKFSTYLFLCHYYIVENSGQILNAIIPHITNTYLIQNISIVLSFFNTIIIYIVLRLVKKIRIK